MLYLCVRAIRLNGRCLAVPALLTQRLVHHLQRGLLPQAHTQCVDKSPRPDARFTCLLNIVIS